MSTDADDDDDGGGDDMATSLGTCLLIYIPYTYRNSSDLLAVRSLAQMFTSSPSNCRVVFLP